MKYLKFVFIAMTLLFFQCDSDPDDIIVEPDPVNISILDLSIDEGNEYTNIAIQLELDDAATQQITANISTSDGTAESNKDFIPFNNQPVVFAVGETEKTYEITIAGDLILEEDEDFEITIVSVSGPATITKATAIVDIINDDVQGEQVVDVIPVLDWGAVAALPVWSEAPYEACNFGQPSNVPNAEYTSVAALGDSIIFNPQNNPVGDTLLYLGIVFNGAEWLDYANVSIPTISPDDSVGVEAFVTIFNNDLNDVELKYDIHMMIGTDNGRLGPYTIDPKIRIPRGQ